MTDLAPAVLAWYDAHARDLPWRRAGTAPWAVLVSEVMLQQTPVARVEPAFERWIERWPCPAALADAPVADALREWGRLGYPRRALRLHAAAVAIVERHGGDVPADLESLLALPGVGSYTARAVASFAFGARHAVVDTNVRRVIARAVTGAADGGPGGTARELRELDVLIPREPAVAARFAVALMELGALVCTARSPRCDDCPLRTRCAWRRAGHPAAEGPPRRSQPWSGSDRQVRGLLMALLRSATGPVDDQALATAWADAAQRRRALTSLVDDGLVEQVGPGLVALAGAGVSARSRPRGRRRSRRSAGRTPATESRPRGT